MDAHLSSTCLHDAGGTGLHCARSYPLGCLEQDYLTSSPRLLDVSPGRTTLKRQFQIRLVNRTLCIILREDTSGTIEDFVTGPVSSTSEHADDMKRYSAERNRLLRSYKGPTRPPMPGELRQTLMRYEF